MKLFTLIFINFLVQFSFSQKILDLHYHSLFGKEKHFQFFNNSEFSYRLKGQLLYRTGKVTNMNDSMLVFADNRIVKLRDIKNIRISGVKLSPYFFGGGVLFFILDTSHNLIVGDYPILKERAAIVSGYFFLGGLIMKYFQDKHVRIKRNTELKVIELDFQNLNQK